MSALFGRKDYNKIIEAFLEKGKIKEALQETIKQGDNLYDEDKKEEALSLYLNLLKLFKEYNVNSHELLEKLYEKIIPILFELGNEDEAVRLSLSLIDEKIALNKNNEAKEILDALLSEYFSEPVVMKYVEFCLKNNDIEKAISTLEQAITRIGANAKFIELTGEILFKVGRYNEAYDYFNALLAIQPDNEKAKERIQEIKHHLSAAEPSQEIQPDKTANVEKKETTVLKSTKTLNIQQTAAEKTKEQPKKVLKVQKNTPSIPKTENPVEENTKEEQHALKEEFSLFKDTLYKSAINTIKKDKEEAFKDLLSLGKTYEGKNLIEAEYLYHKALLLHPDNREVYNRLVDLYDKEKRIEDKIFILSVAADWCKNTDKIYFLRMLEQLDNNAEIKKEIFDTAVQLNDKETAIEYFSKLKDTPELFETLAETLYPTVKDDLRLIELVAREIFKKGSKSQVAFKYYYTLGNMYFNMGNRVDGLKWLMRAHSITSLPLDECIKVAEYIKDLPLDSEKDAIASALNGYVNSISDKNRKEYVYQLLLSLKPNNTVYIREYAEFLEKEGKLKEMSQQIKKLVERMDIASANFIGEKISIVAQYFNKEELYKAAELLQIANRTDTACKIYELLLKRSPEDTALIIKLFYLHAEMEDTKFIIDFFDRYKPSHRYSEIANPIILKLEEKRTSSPLDYHVHFVLGFMYFIVERFEEAIASFQFTARSHHYEPMMHYFIGISFEKIGLPDFTVKQLEMVINAADAPVALKEKAYAKLAMLNKKNGNINEAVKLAKEALKLNPENETAKKILEVLPEETDKITKLEGD